MESPVEFLTPDPAMDQLHEENIPYPPPVKLYAHALKKFFRAYNGHYIRQGFIGEGCSIYVYDFDNKHKSLWIPYSQEPRVVIVYVPDATVPCELDGHRPVTLRKGYSYLFYLPPGVRHKALFPKGRARVVHLNISLTYLKKLEHKHEWIADLIKQVEEQSPTGVQQSQAFIRQEFVYQLERVLQYDGQKRNFDVFMRARVYDLLLEYIHELARNQQLAGNHSANIMLTSEKILLALKIIEANEGKKLSVAEIARRVGLSRYTLQQRFKSKTGLTIEKYQKKFRLNKAAQKLVDNPLLQVKEMARELGYDDESSFIDAFQLQFGVTPLQYRKQQDN